MAPNFFKEISKTHIKIKQENKWKYVLDLIYFTEQNNVSFLNEMFNQELTRFKISLKI